MTKITVDGIDYEVDMEKAKKLGLVKVIEKFKVGDVFAFPGTARTKVMICERDVAKSYVLMGSCGNFGKQYSDAPRNREQMEEYISSNRLQLIGNINDFAPK